MNGIVAIAERVEALAAESERKARELLAQLDSDRSARVQSMVEFNRACAEFRAVLDQIGGAA